MRKALFSALIVCACSSPKDSAQSSSPLRDLNPGSYSLMDAHNAYPENGVYENRIDLALQTGVPVAIEQDLFLRVDSLTGTSTVVVAHDAEQLINAPSLEGYFFERVRSLLDSNDKAKDSTGWPLVVLNLDFKENTADLHDALWRILLKYEKYLTTALKTETDSVTSLTVGPVLVLTGSNSAQRMRFYDAVAQGEKLLLFGAIPVQDPPGDLPAERARAVMAMSASELIAHNASNYERWVNFPWHVVEAGGPNHAADWTPADSARLDSLTTQARSKGLWIRFYTLDGFTEHSNRGFIQDYNFGTESSAQLRWKAAIQAKVDFIATDQYQEFANWRKSQSLKDSVN